MSKEFQWERINSIREERDEFIYGLIDIFETFCQNKKMTYQNSEREFFGVDLVIFGEDYFTIKNQIEAYLVKNGALKENINLK